MKILFQGDSITDAGRDKRNYHELGAGYPKFAAEYIKEAFPDMMFFADVSTFEEAERAVKMGADIVGPTLYGYTEATKHIEEPNLREFARMCRAFGDDCYMIMEGHVYSPEDAIKCLYLGAHAVVVGSAITRPHLITKRFTDLMNGYRTNWRDAERSAH